MKDLKFMPKPFVPDKFLDKIPKFVYLFPPLNNVDLNGNQKEFSALEMFLEEDFLIFLSEDGDIFAYDIKENIGKTIKIFNSILFKAKQISINKIRKTLFIISLLSNGVGRTEIRCNEIKLSKIKEFILQNKEFEYSDFEMVLSRETLLPPSFVEFDDVNDFLLVQDTMKSIKLFALKDYKEYFCYSDQRIIEVRKTQNFLLITLRVDRNPNSINLLLFNILSGQKLLEFELGISPGKQIAILELFKHVLFIKQKGMHPLFINLFTKEINELDRNLSDNSIYAFTSDLLISLEEKNIYIYNMKGKLVKKIEKSKIMTNDYNYNDISYSKNYLAITWKNEVKNSNEPKTQLIEDGSSLMENNPFVNVSNETKSIMSKINEGLKKIKEPNFIQMIEVYDLMDIDSEPIASFSFNNGVDIIAITLKMEEKKIFSLSSFGEIFEISLII